MIGLLAASLALAYSFSAAHRGPGRVTVGDVRVDLPASLNANGPTKTPAGFDALQSYWDRFIPDRRLWVGTVSGSRPRAPLVVLNEVFNEVIDPSALPGLQRWQSPMHFRWGAVTGTFFAGTHPSSAGQVLVIIGVFTEDARRYGMVSIEHVLAESSRVPLALRNGTDLLQRVIASATFEHLRHAEPEDLMSVGLGQTDPSHVTRSRDGPWPDRLRARVVATSRGEEPIHITTNDTARVGVLRIRGVADTGATQASDPLWPAVLLAEQFRHVMGRVPNGQELWSGRAFGSQVWRTTITLSAGMLIQQVWYARLDDRRGLLIDVLCEPQMLSRTAKWVEPVMAAIASWTPPSDGSGWLGWALGDGIARGQLVAQQMRDRLAQLLTPHRAFYLIKKDGQLVGCQVESVYPHAQNDPLPLGGDSRMLQKLGDRWVQVDQQWRCSPDGSRFWFTTRWATRDPDKAADTLSMERMQLVDGRLSLRQIVSDDEREQWSVQVPDAFVLPMVEDRWLVDLTAPWDGAAALVWLTQGRDPPRPYWVHRLTGAGSHEPLPHTNHPIVKEVVLRPLMSLDGDRLGYDADGTVARYESARLTGPSRGAHVVATKTDATAIIKAFPMLESELKTWLKEPSTQ